MKFNVITIFPKLVSEYCSETILGRAQKNNLIKVQAVDLRDFTTDKHRTVDDTPYGGGAGMLMKPEPIYQALQSLDAFSFHRARGFDKVKKIFNGDIKKKKLTILLSPRGEQFNQRLAEKWSKFDEITFVCGRYEGVDERVVNHMVDTEVSIGPYVLAGGELGAMVIIEAVSRLIPGVLGNEESLSEETFGGKRKEERGKRVSEEKPLSTFHFPPSTKEYPQYTKPADFNGWKVPEVLMSGDHKRIAKWKKEQSEKYENPE